MLKKSDILHWLVLSATGSVLLLGATVGLPYFLLASTSPLLQAWFAQARPGDNPYRLFAVSNLASLIVNRRAVGNDTSGRLVSNPGRSSAAKRGRAAMVESSTSRLP